MKKIHYKTFLLSFGVFITLILLITKLVIVDRNNKIIKDLKHKQYNLNQNLKNSFNKQIFKIEEDLFFFRDLVKYYKFRSNSDFLSILKIKANNSKEYDQLRFLNANGIEIIRINNNINNAFVTPQKNLQDKSGRKYFQESKNFNKNKVYYSNYDLNVENGEIEEPYKPMLRVSTPVYNKDEFKGVVIINFLAVNIKKDFIKLLKNSLIAEDVYLLNNKGYYLINKDSNKEFGFMFNHRKGKKNVHKTLRFDDPYSFKKEHPDMAKLLSVKKEGKFLKKGAGLYSFSEIKFANNKPNKNLFIVSFTKEDFLNKKMSNSFKYFYKEILILLIIALIISLILSQNFYKIKNLYSTLKISNKNMKHILENTTDGILQVDALHNLICMNKKAELLTGYKFEELKKFDVAQKLFTNGIDSKKMCQNTCPIYKTFTIRDTIIESGKLFKKSGKSVNIEYKSVPIFKDNSINMVVIFFSRVDNEM